jgi:hypothetical protein
MNTEPIDLEFMGAGEVTASFETAPSTSLESFVLRGLGERGLSARDVQQVFRRTSTQASRSHRCEPMPRTGSAGQPWR